MATTRSAGDNDDHPQHDEEAKGPGYYPPEPNTEKELAYVHARITTLVETQNRYDRELRQFKLLLVIVAYAFIYGYLVGRNNGTSHAG